MKKPIALLLCVLLTASVSLVAAETNQEKREKIWEDIMSLEPQERADLAAGLYMWMTLNAEGDLIQGAFDGAISTEESSEAVPAAEGLSVEDGFAASDTSRKSPAAIGQPVTLELDMYGEYTYSETITLSEVAFGDEAVSKFTESFLIPDLTAGSELVACLFDYQLGEQSDGGDREINVWNTDFNVVYPDGSTVDGSPIFADKINFSLYGGASGSVWVAFGRKIGEPVLVAVEPSNANSLDDEKAPKSKAWFVVK